jgi:hypothetical protein
MMLIFELQTYNEHNPNLPAAEAWQRLMAVRAGHTEMSKGGAKRAHAQALEVFKAWLAFEEICGAEIRSYGSAHDGEITLVSNLTGDVYTAYNESLSVIDGFESVEHFEDWLAWLDKVTE